MFIFKRILWKWSELVINLKFRDVKHLSTEDLAIWLERKDIELPLLLDARKEEEYQVSHLQNARLVPSIIDDLVTWNGIDACTPIVVYCSVGYRSGKVASYLKSLGYKKVFNLKGSIFKWYNEGRSIYRENKRVNEVHPYNKFWGYLLKDNSSNNLQ